MSTRVGSESPQGCQASDRVLSPAQSSRKRSARQATSRGRGASAADDAFWARLEDREEGRLAIEADHLFDTSYAWAA